MVRKITVVGHYLDSSRALMRGELVCIMDNLHIRQLDTAPGGIDHARTVSKPVQAQGSCITMRLGEEVLRKTRWLSAVNGALCWSYCMKILMDVFLRMALTESQRM